MNPVDPENMYRIDTNRHPSCSDGARPRFRLTAVPDHAIFENREFEGSDLTVRAFSISGDLAFVHVNDREVGGGARAHFEATDL